MKKKISLIFHFLLLTQFANGQSSLSFADSIRKAYHIPELAYAVVSSTKVYELQTIGYSKINSSHHAQTTDKFRLGSNTKAITGFIAARLVKQNKIKWDTKFFDLFPELKANSNPAYHDLNLLNLLSFRTKLFPYTYTYKKPKKEQFNGNDSQQRYQFAAWFFQQRPISSYDSINFSNLAYVAAGLMLEKVSQKSYTELVNDLGKELGIQFGFGAPNTKDSLQTWGHDKNLNPEPPGDSYKLNWLMAAGNINASLPDYAKFIQLQLQGLSGQSTLLSQAEFEFLHYGLDRFSIGWFCQTDTDSSEYSYNIGNPGTFLTKVFVFKESDIAIILFSNAQTKEADKGLDTLFNELHLKYCRKD